MGQRGFVYQTVINATPERVWQALTTPEFTRSYWFGRKVESTWELGADVTITTPEGVVEMRGRVLEFEVGKRLSYSWKSSDAGISDEPTIVVFELTAMGPLVKLSVLHDFDEAAATALQAANGWTFIVCGLKTLLETGSPMPALPWRKP
jgi:uncharacterized protein YndB with AHSA1/START domain